MITHMILAANIVLQPLTVVCYTQTGVAYFMTEKEWQETDTQYFVFCVGLLEDRQ